MGVKLEKLIEKMSLKNLTPDLDLTQSEIQVRISIVRHCSLQGILTILIRIVFRSSDM